MNKVRTLSVLNALAVLAGCEAKQTSSPGVPEDVQSIIFLQRVPRNEGVGNVFDYTSFRPGGRIVKLEPPAADGKLTVLTSDPMFDGADFMAWDLSFDARSIVFSARIKDEDRYHLFTMGVDGSNPRQVTEGPNDYVYPIFVPGGKIMFMTSKVVEAGAPQFRDEYERQTTAQVGTINADGTGEMLGPRNVSHRVAPALIPDGSVVYTEWLHLGNVNDGHLRMMNSDMSGMREAFGGEPNKQSDAYTNSYLKARWVDKYKAANGKDAHRLVAIGTSRDDTLQAGKLLFIDLGTSEKQAYARDLTPLVPGDRIPSNDNIGRYYDAEPLGVESLGISSLPRLLVSWANGPVHSELLAMGKTEADFGIYLFDADANGGNGRRYLVYNSPDFWDVLARPVRPRPAPAPTLSASLGASFTVGALNVYETSITRFKLNPGSVVKVRLLEGFSSEEGFPDMFGLTEFDGQSRLGEAPVYPDGSFAAKVPANVPIHMQLVDKFGMSLASEDIWVSGRAGEQRFCGGCHEDRAKSSLIAPGSIEAVQRGAMDLDVKRVDRISREYTYDKVRGVPWNLALQPVFDAKCASCHNGVPGPANRQYTVTDKTTMTSQTFVFDLRGHKVNIMVGEDPTGDFTASYISLVGLGMELGENDVTITGDYKSFITPGEAAKSDVVKKVNPPQRFPSIDPNTRAFQGAVHPTELGGEALTPDEYYLLMLNIDMGAQYYFRENKGRN